MELTIHKALIWHLSPVSPVLHPRADVIPTLSSSQQSSLLFQNHLIEKENSMVQIPRLWNSLCPIISVSVLICTVKTGARLLTFQPSDSSGMHGKINICILQTEIIAAWVGVRTAVNDLKLHNVLVEGDSATVVSWLQSKDTHKYHHIPFIQDLCGWKHSASFFHVMHIFREANQLVYYMANTAHTCDFHWNFDTELDMQCKQLWYAGAYNVPFFQSKHLSAGV